MKQSINKRLPMLGVVVIMITLFSLLGLSCKKAYERKKNIPEHHIVYRKKNSRFSLKDKPIDLKYHVVYKEPVMKDIDMIGFVYRYGVDGDKGKILRVKRFKNVADAIAEHYGNVFSGDLLLAMSAQESGGADLLPNGNDDGGFGLIHMQGSTASDFGLQTYKDCDELVCHKHGHKLRQIIEENNYDRKKLVSYDDRLNPILNMDAVGRMLAFNMQGKRIRHLSRLQTAICRYSGSYNYRKYYAGVQKYLKLLHDRRYIKSVKTEFNKRNSDFTIDGKKATYDDYMRVSLQQNFNYGLQEYIDLGKFKY